MVARPRLCAKAYSEVLLLLMPEVGLSAPAPIPSSAATHSPQRRSRDLSRYFGREELLLLRNAAYMMSSQHKAQVHRSASRENSPVQAGEQTWPGCCGNCASRQPMFPSFPIDRLPKSVASQAAPRLTVQSKRNIAPAQDGRSSNRYE